MTAAVDTQASAPIKAGFIRPPALTFLADEGAAGGSFYDSALGRWVPARPPVLAADGLSYAYFDGGTKPGNLELVDLKSGAYRLLATGGPWQVVGIAGDAVYVRQTEYVDSAAYGQLAISRGLWKIPQSGGAPVRLTSDTLFWSWVDGRYAYAAGSTMDVAGGPNPVVRFDFAKGQVETWFDHGARTRLFAVDATGAGLAIVEGADEQLWRIPASGDPVKVWSGSTDALRPWSPVAVRGTEVWFSSTATSSQWAIYHYTPAKGLEQMALFTDRPVTVAGACA